MIIDVIISGLPQLLSLTPDLSQVNLRVLWSRFYRPDAVLVNKSALSGSIDEWCI